MAPPRPQGCTVTVTNGRDVHDLRAALRQACDRRSLVVLRIGTGDGTPVLAHVVGLGADAVTISVGKGAAPRAISLATILDVEVIR